MSGYLQRIAAGAVAARPRVHPFVDSRFAPVRREESAGPMEAHETKAAAAPRTTMDSQESAEPPRIEATEIAVRHEVERVAEKLVARPEIEVEPARRVVREQTPAARQESEDYKPMLPQRVEITPVRADGLEMGAKTAEAAEQRQPVGAAVPAMSRDEAKVWRFQPLIERVEGASSADVASVLSAPMALRREATAMPRAAARRTTAAHGVVQRQMETSSDDIQIHIGRIEVTAVHPPAPRPVAAPARKTMSLDEYLRGSRGGRA